MTVSNIVKNKGLSHLLNPREFRRVKPVGADLLVDYIKDVIREETKVMLVGDTDLDGIIATKNIFDCIKNISPSKQLDVYEHSYKVHGVTDSIMYDIIKLHYTHLIVLDSSTNNVEQLNKLGKLGIKVLVIDHHMPKVDIKDFNKNILLLNNKMDIKNGYSIPYCEVSAGCLVAIYCDYVLNSFGITMSDDYWLNAVVTLYSDSMDLLDEYNVMLINYVRNKSYLYPTMRLISGKKKAIVSRELITYSIAPKINACVRTGNFSVIRKLFFEENSYEEMQELCENINKINSDVKEYLSKEEENILPVQMLDVSLINLTDYIDTILIDFKGLLANKATETTASLSIAYYVKNNVVYGSVRDYLSRDVLTVFSEFCKADGHPSAFGFEIEDYLLEDLIRYASISLNDISSMKMQPVIIDENKDDLTLNDINDMCILNEYCTQSNFYLKVKLDPEVFRITSYNNKFFAKSIKYSFIGNVPISYGDVVLVLPTYDIKPKLIIKTRSR